MYELLLLCYSRIQIWLSADGGYNFHCLLTLPDGESVVDFDFGRHDLAILTSSGRIVYGKVNSQQFEQLDVILLPTNITKLVFDSSGALGAYTLHSQVCIEMYHAALVLISLSMPVSLHTGKYPYTSDFSSKGNRSVCMHTVNI